MNRYVLHRAFLASSLVLSAQGATLWTGANSTDYNDALNWNPSTVPATTEAIEMSTGTAVRNGNLDRAALSTLSGDASLTIQNGRFLNGSGGTGDFQVNGGTLSQTGNYFIVSINQPASIVQTGGVVNSSIDRGWFMSDGGTSSGTYEIGGGSLNVVTSGSQTANNNFAVHIGKQSGDDALLVNGGSANFTATVANTRTYVSKGSRVEVNSGSLSFSGFRFISVGRDGDATTTSKMLINGGTVNVSGQAADGAVVIGNGNTGLISMGSGDFHLVNGPMWVGDGGAGGSYVQTGGTLMLDDGQIVVGRNGWGIFTLDGGTATARNIQLNRDDAMVNLNGGMLTVDGLGGSAPTRGTVNFNGTEIRPGANFFGGPFISNLTHAYIGEKGLKIEIADGQEASISQELAHSPEVGAHKDGGLTKKGPGTLLLDQPSSYNGPTKVEAGTLAMIYPTLDDRSTLNIASTATLDLYHAEVDTVRSVVIGSQTLATGVWGAPGSGAQHIHPNLAGYGFLNVTNGAAETAFESWILGTGLPAALTGADADGDSDGVANLIEFATGGNPTELTSPGVRVIVPQVQGGVLTIAARNGASFTAEGGRRIAEVDGIRYEVEGSTDLSNWDASVEEVTAVTTGVTVPAAGFALRSFRVAGASEGKSFLRLVVTQVP
ncbi:autotransporter-associated beta strand repeat-containing protein [Luteolibacter luteus]|uniref:Uncharacterized protein n=1 Tax=Luteolibacter luteus TaxID=2728835 RepID=A0A858RHK4_9BACT|nr:autotransporter-associated beta strand repeat-containing protein [Luteolibacter luteus]QJE95899.1 hypothetical protein HHL09_08935 [Luteolibacter luteus]